MFNHKLLYLSARAVSNAEGLALDLRHAVARHAPRQDSGRTRAIARLTIIFAVSHNGKLQLRAVASSKGRPCVLNMSTQTVPRGRAILERAAAQHCRHCRQVADSTVVRASVDDRALNSVTRQRRRRRWWSLGSCWWRSRWRSIAALLNVPDCRAICAAISSGVIQKTQRERLHLRPSSVHDPTTVAVASISQLGQSAMHRAAITCCILLHLQ